MIFKRGKNEVSEEDHGYLKAFFDKCVLGRVDQIGTTSLGAPPHLRNALKSALANDLRPGLAKQMLGMEKTQNLISVRPKNTRKVRGLISMAKTAVLNDAQFQEWLETRSRRQIREAVQFRDLWLRTNLAVEHAKTEIEAHAELAKENAGLEGPNLAEGGLIAFLSKQTVENWHVFMCGIEWECSKEPDILAAAAWILRQETCDRTTALAFLAMAHQSDIGTEPYGHVDTSAARTLMEEVATRLDVSGYDDQNLAVPDHAADDLERYQSVASGAHAQLTWTRQDETAAPSAPAAFYMVRNQPRLSFERWASERGSSAS